MRILEYIKKYGNIEIKDKNNNWIFYSDGINQIGGKFKAKDIKRLGMF